MKTPTKNREIYLKDPSMCKLVNEGVANVNDGKNSQALAVLRYELETFVCDGQYEKGMFHILETYLKNINQPKQPAVWVSGFYGSGKSHLVKMLRALWEDTNFDDGASARGIAKLPESVTTPLRELSTQGKRHGGLHAASGTLGAGASGSVRLALLRIIFKSAGLPEQYPQAKFLMWLRKNDILEVVKKHIEDEGLDWNEELDDFYVSESLHKALCTVKPNPFSSPSVCLQALIHLYPNISDVSSEDMLKDIEQALKKDGKLPLTLVVLDEVQQYIGEDSQRSIDVQEAVEACCTGLGSKLLFIGTGQTAVTGTANLKKLEGRFTVRVELSDADVDSVIRQVILAKSPDALEAIKEKMEANLGEISRHMAGSAVAHRPEDVSFFCQDYPILPVRRRFWELTFRVLDQTGTDSQLRNQLSMIHKVIQTNIDEPLGHVVPADYLYFDSADKLQQARVLPRKLHQKTMTWIRGTEDEKLMARACGVIFLINKILNVNKEAGIRATSDAVADLLIESLPQGSASLRSRLPEILDRCELLMKVGEEYRIQTEESTAWNDDFLGKKSILANEAHRVDAERDDRLRKNFAEITKKLTLTQGESAVSREVLPVFDAQLPPDATKKVCVWVRNGWGVDENSVRADARQAGNQSPVVFVFIPKRSADDLRRQIIDFKAADSTLEARGTPTSPEGRDARAAMETTRLNAQEKINELIEEAFSGARVYQGGGSEVSATTLREAISEATKASLQRLFPNFSIADNKAWSKVYEKAQKGAPDALKAVGYEGEASANPVCKAIFSQIGSGKKGAEIRDLLESAPYGWSGDAVDGGLHVLLVSGIIRAENEHGKAIDGKDMERKAIGKTKFKVEATTVTPRQKIEIRKLFQKLSIHSKGEESASLPQFLTKLSDLVERAGGESPKPERPKCAALQEANQASGNEQLLALFNHREELTQQIDDWTKISEKIEARWKAWLALNKLANHAATLSDAKVFVAQMVSIQEGRQLLADPDAITPLAASISQALRVELNRIESEYDSLHQKGMQTLQVDSNWQQLEQEQKNELLRDAQLVVGAKPKIAVQSTDEIVATLDRMSLSGLIDRVAALSTRFNEVLTKAAELMEPEAQFVEVSRRTLKTSDDIATWLDETKLSLSTALQKGPVVIR